MSTNTFRVSWLEQHRITALVEANTPEEAVSRVINDDSEYISIEDIETYGDMIPDTFETELADDDDV